MGISKLIQTALLLAFVLTSCSRIELEVYEVYPDIKLKSESKKNLKANMESIENLLAEVWDSGFLSNNELIREEILNNHYGLFGKDSELSYLKGGRACYIKKKGHKDRVMLSTNLFGHFEKNSQRDYEFKWIDKRIHATLIHELFHDFWHNTLDSQKRYMFSIESEIFYREMSLAQTTKDKLKFLSSIGFNKPKEDNFKPYEELKELRKNYSDKKFFGVELYSIIADRSFSGKMIIPKQLRKFYKGIVSEATLKKSKI